LSGSGYMKKLLVLLLCFWICFGAANANDKLKEISLCTHVHGFGGFEAWALYDQEANLFYFPVAEFFRFLQVEYKISVTGDSVTGKAPASGLPFLIDVKKLRIRFENINYMMRKNELIKADKGIYLRSEFFKDIFGFYLTLDTKRRSGEIKTYADQEDYRVLRLKEIKYPFPYLEKIHAPESLLTRNYHLFKPGVVEWGFRSVQQVRKPIAIGADLGFGAEILGGEANVFLNYDNQRDFLFSDQQYNWRWVNNNNHFLKQIFAGKINPSSHYGIHQKFHGITLSNAGTEFNRTGNTYRISDFSEPGWSVELYVNNVLVDYTIADASGFFTFDIPLVYGSSTIRMKFYGPYGEERIREKFVDIPYNFISKGKVEYKLTGGAVDNTDLQGFARAEANFGAFSFLTLGGGYEYFYDPAFQNDIVFLKASVNPAKNLLIFGEYAHEVNYSGRLYYQLPFGMAVDIFGAAFNPDREFPSSNGLESDLRGTLISPLIIGKVKGLSMLSYMQTYGNGVATNSMDLTYSMQSGKVKPHITAMARWNDENTPQFNAKVSAAIDLGNFLLLRPQIFADISNQKFLTLRAELEQRIFRAGYMSVIADRNVATDKNMLHFALRYDIPFAQTNVSATFTEGDIAVAQGARGSIAFGGGRLVAENKMLVGRASISVIPFIDINHNGIQDFDEPNTQGVNVRINKGYIYNDAKASVIQIVGLETHTRYLIEIDDAKLRPYNLGITKRQFVVETDPNQFKKLHVPVLPLNRITGAVNLNYPHAGEDFGNINLALYNAENKLIATALPDETGSYAIKGIPPGPYSMKLDTGGFHNRNLTVYPQEIKVTIPPMMQGTLVENPAFSISIMEETVPAEEVKTEEGLQRIVIEEPSVEDTLPEKDSLIRQELHPTQFWLVTATMSDKAEALNLARQLTEKYEREFVVIPEDQSYKVVHNLNGKPEDAVKLAIALYDLKIDAYVVEKAFAASMPETLKPEKAEPRPDQIHEAKPEPVSPDTTKIKQDEPKVTTPELQTELKEIPAGQPIGLFYLQAGAFTRERNATELANRINRQFLFNSKVEFSNNLYKVITGPFPTMQETRSAMDVLLINGIDSFRVDAQ
jgi:cell division protein FtsN